MTATQESGPVACIFGAGPGLGMALAARFAGAGFRVAMAARDPERLAAHAASLDASGIQVRHFPCDVTLEKDVHAVFDAVGSLWHPPDLVAYNAGAFRPGKVVEIPVAEFEQCWRVGCLGGFLVGREAARRMLPRGSGTLLFTGATASLRGSAGFANLAVGKFGLRALSQSLARELGPQGIHVAHVIVDGRIAPEGGESGRDDALDPFAIAENYLNLHRQPRSAWTLELDLRPWVERF